MPLPRHPGLSREQNQQLLLGIPPHFGVDDVAWAPKEGAPPGNIAQLTRTLVKDSRPDAFRVFAFAPTHDSKKKCSFPTKIWGERREDPILFLQFPPGSRVPI